MKKLISFIILCCIITLKVTADDNKRTLIIEVSEAGTLHETFTEKHRYLVHFLEILGPINKSDMIFLNEISRMDFYGRIPVINLKNAIVQGEKIPDEIFGTYTEGSMIYRDTIASSLSKITLPDNVTEIGEFTFCSLPYLKEITLPSALKNIGAYAFSKCTALETITIPKELTELPMGCFSECTSLKEVSLPSSLVSLGAYSFENTALEDIVLPEKLEKIGRYAFKSTNLKKISIPASCTNINIYAFEGNNQLTDIILPNTLSRLPYGMFSHCTALQKVNIPEGVITIGKNAFAGCSALKEVTLPATLQTVENEAFLGFNAEIIVLPENLSYIGVDAFKGNSKLKCIYSKSETAPRFATESSNNSNNINITGFNVENSQIPIYIPKGTSENYKETPGWSYFKNFIEVEEFPSF